jgi:hypothetical protein
MDQSELKSRLASRHNREEVDMSSFSVFDSKANFMDQSWLSIGQPPQKRGSRDGNGKYP